MAYLGREPLYGAFEKQALTPDGSTTTFTLDYTVGSASSLLVSVAGVHQEPDVAYNLGSGGTQIVFTAAPSSSDTVFLVFLGIALEVATIGTSAIQALTDLTTGLQGADELLVYDNSANENKKVNLDNLIVGQTELSATAADDDVLLIYDTSATEIKKIQKSNIATVITFTTDSTNSGDGSTTDFTINSGRSVDDILVIVNGVTLVPTTDYTISSTKLTFITAPENGAEIVIRYLG